MAGIAVELNMMLWMYGGLVNMVLGAIYFLGFMFAHQQYHSVEEDSSSSAAAVSDAESAMSWLEMRSYMQMAWTTHTFVALYRHHKDWMEAQWNALPEEAKEKYKEDYEMEGEEKEEMFSKLFRF